MKYVRKDIMNLALPVLTEQFFVMLMGVVNTIMVSNIGKEAVSAVGMVDSINNIFISFFSALAVGSTVVIAHFTGQNKISRANESVKQAIFSGLVISLLITLLIFVFKSQLIALLFGAAEPSVIAGIRTYLQITLLTYPLIAVTLTASGVLRGAGDTRTPMKITIIMNIINVILSWLLIYGLKNPFMNIPGMGVKGAALGIAGARITGTVLILKALISGSKVIKFQNLKGFRLDMNIQKSIFGVGVPASVESLLFQGGRLITQIYIVGMGTASIAANSIALSIFGIVNIPGVAMSIAAVALVGQFMGRGDTEGAEDSIKYILKLASALQLPTAIASIVFANRIILLYTHSPDVIEHAVVLVRTAGVAIPLFWPIAFILSSALKGAGDARYTMIISVSTMWIFRITLGYIFGIPLKLGVLGVWMGMYSDWIVRGGLFYFRLVKGKWKSNTVIKGAGASAGIDA